jgi:stage IV sporulation protein B
MAVFLFPFSVLAYSEYVIPGGENIGIEIRSKGIMVIGFYKVNGSLSNNALRVGDVITAINDREVNSINELIVSINELITDNKINVTYSRGRTGNRRTTLTLDQVDGVYKTGLYVKDSITGIGTLTYIDPNTLIYGALGHEIIESATKNRVEVKTGVIFRSMVTSIDRSANGVPGGKNARFHYNTEYGDITKNTNYGIYGNYNIALPNREPLKVGTKDDIELGKAHIYTVLNGEQIEQFEIEVTRIIKDTRIKNIHFKITDERLLSRTGGVVQGMSGSPIIQNDMIIGAVTHVITNQVDTGFGIFITTMLEEGER